MSDDETVNLNNRMKSAMRQTETSLNKGGAQGQKVRSTSTTSGAGSKGRGPLNTSTNPNK
jgi:hypothetical protein